MAEVWIPVCKVDELDEQDVRRFDHGGRTFAIYRLTGNSFHATDGLCTHAKVHLCGGMVMGNIIECPKHNGRFEIPTGKAVATPARTALNTYPVKVEGDVVYLGLDLLADNPI